MTTMLHSRDEARGAKQQLSAKFGGNDGITSFGIGMTEARDSYAVTVTVDDAAHAAKLPDEVEGVPVRVLVTGAFAKF